MYFVTDIKLVDMQSNSYRHLNSYNNKAKTKRGFIAEFIR